MKQMPKGRAGSFEPAKPHHTVSVVTVTLGRPSLRDACESVNAQTFGDWHHYVVGDGVLPVDYAHPQRSTFGFSRSLGAEEPGRNMPDGTPNPLLRWALSGLRLGEFVCFLDDDNVYHPEFLEKLYSALAAHPEAGIALCPAEDLRYGLHEMDGYPEPGRCDNSAFLVRSPIAQEIGFPPARPDKDVEQDYEFIRACADQSGWVRVPDQLLQFGKHPNPPPLRGGTRIVFSWSLPIRGVQLIKRGEFNEGIAVLRRSIEFDGHDAWAQWHLGEALYRSGRTEEAASVWLRWDRLIEDAGETPDDWIDYCRALVQLAREQDDAAAAYLDRALRRADARALADSDDADNHLNRAIYRLAAGRGAEALAILMGLLELPLPERLQADAARDLALLALLLPHSPEIRRAIRLLEPE
jgi:tetratricopeptide (TPR) repeat protein